MLVHRRPEILRIARIDHELCRAGVLIDVQRLGPGLSAVARHEHAALGEADVVSRRILFVDRDVIDATAGAYGPDCPPTEPIEQWIGRLIEDRLGCGLGEQQRRNKERESGQRSAWEGAHAPEHARRRGRTSRAPASAATAIHAVAARDPDYGFFGTAPGLNRSRRSFALTASPRYGPTWKISCIVRKSDECV